MIYVHIGQIQFNEIRKRILRLGIEMATSAQRDRFVENPVDQVNVIIFLLLLLQATRMQIK